MQSQLNYDNLHAGELRAKVSSSNKLGEQKKTKDPSPRFFKGASRRQTIDSAQIKRNKDRELIKDQLINGKPSAKELESS